MELESKQSDEYDGKNRTLYGTACRVCGRTKWVPKHQLERTKTCSVECRRQYKPRHIAVQCATCTKEFTRPQSKAQSKSGLHFCSRACKEQAQKLGGRIEIQPSHYNSNIAYRVKARRAYPPICTQCGFVASKKMLDIDHIDGDRSNNALDNLQVLCVWCHAEKTRIDWPEPEWEHSK
jgi:hypothetical protein